MLFSVELKSGPFSKETHPSSSGTEFRSASIVLVSINLQMNPTVHKGVVKEHHQSRCSMGHLF